MKYNHINMPNTITSRHNHLVKELHALTRAKNPEYILIQSHNCLKECLASKNNIKIILCTQKWYTQYGDKLQIAEEKIVITTIEVINKISFNKSPQEFIIVFKYEIQNFEITPIDNYIVLDHISDPGNLGTILRSAVAFGFKKIFISNDSVSILNDKVIRASMTAIFDVSINLFSDLKILLQELKKHTFTIYAGDINSNAIPLSQCIFKKPWVMIFSNESQGLQQSVLPLVNQPVFIEIENIESLNVSNASAIIMYQLKYGKK